MLVEFCLISNTVSDLMSAPNTYRGSLAGGTEYEAFRTPTTAEELISPYLCGLETHQNPYAVLFK